MSWFLSVLSLIHLQWRAKRALESLDGMERREAEEGESISIRRSSVMSFLNLSIYAFVYTRQSRVYLVCYSFQDCSAILREIRSFPSDLPRLFSFFLLLVVSSSAAPCTSLSISLSRFLESSLCLCLDVDPVLELSASGTCRVS